MKRTKITPLVQCSRPGCLHFAQTEGLPVGWARLPDGRISCPKDLRDVPIWGKVAIGADGFDALVELMKTATSPLVSRVS